MIRSLTILVLVLMSGCAATQQGDGNLWSRVAASVAGVLSPEPDPMRDNEQREQLALVAPQEIVEPDDPELREAVQLRESYYKAHDPLYPGIHYAADAGEE